MSQFPPTTDATPLDRDVICVTCGYNLRTQARNGRCPECNTPVGKSLRMPSLADESRTYLNNLRTGAIAYGCVSIFNGINYLLISLMQFVYLPQFVAFSEVGRTTMAIGAMLSRDASWIGLAGVWFVTTPSENDSHPGLRRSSRRARWAIGCIVSLELIDRALSGLHIPMIFLSAPNVELGIAYSAGNWFTAIYFFALAMMLRKIGLSRIFRQLAWVLAGSEFLAIMASMMKSNQQLMFWPLLVFGFANLVEGYCVLHVAQSLRQITATSNRAGENAN